MNLAETCPECGARLTKRHQKNDKRKRFIGCTRYPECSFTKPMSQETIMREQGQPELFSQLPNGS